MMNSALHKMHDRYAISCLQFQHEAYHLGIIQLDQIREGMNMSIIENFRNWRRYQRTVDELNRLSNRELADIGVSRDEIRRLARTRFAG